MFFLIQKLRVNELNEERELWDKYCSFLEKPFFEQITYCEERLKKYFEKWNKTKTARSLMRRFQKKFERFEDVPPTTYGDYSILHRFGAKMDALIINRPRKKGERLFNYYSRLFSELKPMLNGWLIGEFGYAAKTSGTSGKPKWIVHNAICLEDYERSCVALASIMCSEKWGETKAKEGDTGLNIAAPIPYISGWGLLLGSKHFKIVPSIDVAEEITDMGKRLWIILKEIEKGRKPDYAAGVASFFQLVCKYLKNKANIFREYYESLNFGSAKIYMLFKWLFSYAFSESHKNIRELLPLKGLGVAGVNIAPYKDFFVKEFGVEPTNIYGSTEFPVMMYGPPDRKTCLIPDLRMGYYEFIDEKGELKRIDELRKGETYEIVGTSIWGMLVRYRVEDLLTVVDFRDDGMPYFIFKSRVNEMLDFYGYFRITESIFSEVLNKANLKYFEKWAVAKEVDEKGERLLVLMERPWENSEMKAAKIIFNSLRQVSNDFQNYVKDFSIKNPQEIIRVEYLNKGAFLRYSLKKIKEGVEPGQIKPPKIIPCNRKEVLDLLRQV